MRTRTGWGMVVLLAAAFALRLVHLGTASLWYDETVSLFLARQDLVSLTAHTAGDIHPPFYYYLLHFWGGLAGWSEFSSAFLSLVFGILLVALTYRIGQEWFDRPTGLVAALLVALSPYNLWYSQEVRMYTLGATLGLLSVYLGLRILEGKRRRRDFLAYAMVSALGIYTLYFFAFLLVFENLVALVWIIYNRRRDWIAILRAWVIAELCILVLYLPWAPVAFRQAADPPVPPWRSSTPLDQMLVESFKALALGQSVEAATVLPVLLLVAALIGIALAARSVRHGSKIVSPLFLLGYTFVPLAVIAALSAIKPLYHVRYIFTYSPGFYLLVALGLVQLIRVKATSLGRVSRLAFIAALAILAAASAYSAYNFWYDPAYADDDLRGAVQHLTSLWRPGDAILIDAGYTYVAFDYYNSLPITWRGRLTDYVPSGHPNGVVVLETGSIGGEPNLGWQNPESDFYATTEAETRAALDRVFAAHPRVWLLRIYDTVVDPTGVIRDYVATHGRIIDDAGFAGSSFARVQGYLTPLDTIQEVPVKTSSQRVLWGERVLLLGWDPLPGDVRAGSPLDVNLYWQSVQPTNVDAHLLVGLFSGDGRLVVSNEEVPLGDAWGTSRWGAGSLWREPVRLTVPSNLTPGNYLLRIALYNPLTNEPLATGASPWVREDGQLELGPVHVR